MGIPYSGHLKFRTSRYYTCVLCARVFDRLGKIWGCYAWPESLLPKLGKALCRKAGCLQSQALRPVSH